jgi:hypothetical protein
MKLIVLHLYLLIHDKIYRGEDATSESHVRKLKQDFESYLFPALVSEIDAVVREIE